MVALGACGDGSLAAGGSEGSIAFFGPAEGGEARGVALRATKGYMRRFDCVANRIAAAKSDEGYFLIEGD